MMRFRFKLVISVLVLLCFAAMSMEIRGQLPNYDESKVPNYELPNILQFEHGKTVDSAADWKRRRLEIVDLFSRHVFGVMPTDDETTLDWTIDEFDVQLSDSVNSRFKQVTLKISRGTKFIPVKVLVILPEKSDTPNPVFVAYNFDGNHTVHGSPKIDLGKVWKTDPTDRRQRIELDAKQEERGKKTRRWPVEEIVRRGFGLVTLYYGDVDPDFDDRFKNGVHELFPELQNQSDNWTSIGGWAWGLHRVMDFIEKDPDIDHNRVALLGHSRLGKTALWAGATDERFSLVISNNSGCGGAALSRRQFGETVARINHVFPHWFCKKHKQFNNRESEMPVDQHMLLAAIAPRSLYVASAAEDLWADPRGEFLATYHASKAWSLFHSVGSNHQSFLTDKMPDVNKPVFSPKVGYHIRSGKHDVKKYDWQQFLQFAKERL